MKLQPLDLSATRLCADTLARCTYPFDAVAPDVVIPVEVADLSRYLKEAAASIRGAIGTHSHDTEPHVEPDDLPGFGHAHVYTEDGEEGHGIIVRQQVYGLYFLPTARYPAGRISVERSLNAELQAEVLLCEIAHGIDYVVMTVEQRRAIAAAYAAAEGPHPDHDTRHGWFDTPFAQWDGGPN